MTTEVIQPGFRGFVDDPQSELEVAYLFGLAQEYLPFPLVVTAINDAFPDCEGLDPITGKRVAIELEVRSRNFISHRHPIKGCDYIVCWEDDWKDAPTDVREKIICLKDLFRTKPTLARKFIDRPIPESLRAQLVKLQETNPKAYAAVTHLLMSELPQVQLRIPGVILDDTGTKHFSIKYGSGKGVLGVYPAGKLVVGSVHDMVARYGEPVRTPTRRLRDIVADIGVLTSRKQCPALVAALEAVMLVVRQLDPPRPRGGGVKGGQHTRTRADQRPGKHRW